MSKEAESESMMTIIVRQFLAHRFAVVSLILIVVFVLIAIFAPLCASLLGVNPESTNITNKYQPANSHVTEEAPDNIDELVEKWLYEGENAKLVAEAGLKATYKSEGEDVPYLTEDDVAEAEDIADIDGSSKDLELAIILWEKSLEDKDMRAGLEKSDNKYLKHLVQPVELAVTHHKLGTDELGRDVLIRLIYGSRVSIGVGLLVAFASGLIGMIVGCISGYFGGFIDAALMRVTDALLALPMIPVLIIFAAVDLNKIPGLQDADFGDHESIYKIVTILILFTWMTTARIVRGSVLAVKEQEYIASSKAIGASRLRIIVRHIIPNIIAPFLIAVSLNIGNAILYEAALSFLGFGIQPPTPSWGNMLTGAQELINHDVARTQMLYPGFLIFIVVIAFNFIDDGLRDALDPRIVKR